MSDINIIPAPKIKPDYRSLLTKSNAHVIDAMDVMKNIMLNPNAKDSDKLNAAKSWLAFNIQLQDEIQKSQLRAEQIKSIQLNNKAKQTPKVENYKKEDVVKSELDVDGGFGFVGNNQPLRN